jgi:hypothetical protein
MPSRCARSSRARSPTGQRERVPERAQDIVSRIGWALEVQQPEIEVFTIDEGRWTYTVDGEAPDRTA